MLGYFYSTLVLRAVATPYLNRRQTIPPPSTVSKVLASKLGVKASKSCNTHIPKVCPRTLCESYIYIYRVSHCLILIRAVIRSFLMAKEDRKRDHCYYASQETKTI